MEFAETLSDTASWHWRDRQLKTGWDLCVLALGSTGGIFTLPQVLKMLGADGSIETGILTLLFIVIFGLGIAFMRKLPKDRLTGWHGNGALLLGGTALTIPWYIVLKS
jgi:hypothetical protein